MIQLIAHYNHCSSNRQRVNQDKPYIVCYKSKYLHVYLYRYSSCIYRHNNVPNLE